MNPAERLTAAADAADEHLPSDPMLEDLLGWAAGWLREQAQRYRDEATSIDGEQFHHWLRGGCGRWAVPLSGGEQCTCFDQALALAALVLPEDGAR